VSGTVGEIAIFRLRPEPSHFDEKNLEIEDEARPCFAAPYPRSMVIAGAIPSAILRELLRSIGLVEDIAAWHWRWPDISLAQKGSPPNWKRLAPRTF
jgi:hypothetical protein